MTQYLEFIANHWELFLALAVIVALLVVTTFGERLRGLKSVSPLEATQLMNRRDAVVVDVREDNEFHAGHIPGSVHVPLGYLQQRLGELDKYKGRPIIVGCRSGNRSGRAASTLKKHGFEEVYNLGGGILAWENASLPLTKKK